MFKIFSTAIENCYELQLSKISDNRGFFSRLFCCNELSHLLVDRKIMQVNFSSNLKVGTIRGIHFQKKPFMEMKFIKCISGGVWDVVVDLRKNSNTFLKWKAFELSEEKNNMIILSEGMGHGYQVIKPNTKLIYFHTNVFKSDYEDGINYLDPKLKINWPLEMLEISKKDISLRFIGDDFEGIEV